VCYGAKLMQISKACVSARHALQRLGKRMRSLGLFLVSGLFATFAGSHSFAQAYPNKPVRFIIPFLPGGSADFFARAVAPELKDRLGQPVVIDNRGGAAGTIGAELASRAVADGHTLFLATANLAMGVSLYTHWPVKPIRDFRAVSLLGSAPNILAVNASMPVRNVKELIALAKTKPGQIGYASAGSGSTSHLAVALLETMANIDLLHVPYKGTGPGIVSVISGESSVIMPPASVVLPHDKAGKLRALAISSATRFDAAPQLPTVAEAGVPRYEASQWYGVMVPAATPQPVVKRLNAELTGIVQSPAFKARMLAQATMISGTTPEEFSAYLKDEIEKWSKVIKLSGASLD
jgi:tripartite-type tricarboxylate transporter receptor subunit TctC